ncbi:MAG TPA: hypothetical protein VIY29_12885 [Ktedonobacteraceae bacterium]
MYTAERQRAQPYLDTINGPLYEQWYLLHHRMIRIVTNRSILGEQVQHFLYYAELLAEYSYETAAQLPVEIPIDLLWQAGQRLYRPVAFTCYLFETRTGEAFPPPPAEARPDSAVWEDITGVDGPLRARWKRGSQRFREYQPFPGVSSRISSVLDKTDLWATLYVEDVSKCASWFLMRFVFYMLIGARFGCDGYEIVHAAAIALHGSGALIVGSPGSGKSTLVLSCLHLAEMSHLADDVLFLAKDDGVVHIYAFPEDIGVRQGASELLGRYEFMQKLENDARQKSVVAVQQYFQEQVVGSCAVRVMLLVHASDRSSEFRAERVAPAQAVSWLMQEYISQQKAKEGEADYMFDIFSDMAAQAPAYRLWLTPDAQENAHQVRALLLQHV